MSARHSTLLALALTASVASTACGHGASNTPAPPLASWDGRWRAVEVYMRNGAFDAVAAALRDRRPEYTVEEITAFFTSVHDVDFTDLTVAEDILTFLDGEITVCAGRYAPVDASAAGDGTGHGMGHGHGHEATEFSLRLAEARGGDCSAYTVVTFASTPEVASDAQGPIAHFHVRVGPPRSAPWGPAVMTPVEDSRFGNAMRLNLSGFAEGLPKR